MSVVSQGFRTFFTNYNVATTGYIYNESDGANATTGWLKCDVDEILMQISCATIEPSRSVQYRIEGRFPTLNRNASIKADSISTAHTVDLLQRVTEHPEEIRIGFKLDAMVASPTGSPNKVYAGVCFSDYKR